MAIQWFPGHMHLTRKAIQERIKEIDVVIELLDSRLPGSSASTPVTGLFLAGGSVHPGPGVPMAALSGQLAAAAVMASPALTRWSPRVATSGGTLTP